MKRWLLAGLLTLTLVIVAGTSWLITSESGLRWAYRQAGPLLPGELHVVQLSGRMNDIMVLQGVEFSNASARLSAQRIILRWDPWALLSAEIAIPSLVIEQLQVELLADAGNAQAASDPGLPQVELPLALKVQALMIDQAQLDYAGQRLVLDQFKLAADIHDSQLTVHSLEMRAANPGVDAAYLNNLQASLAGEITIRGDYPHRFAINWQAGLPSGALVTSSTRIEGDLAATRLSHQSSGPLQAQLSVQLQDALEQLSWQAEIDIARFDTGLLDPALPLLNGSLQLTATGDSTTARASGRLDADSADFGRFDARFELRSLDPPRLAEGLHIESLDVGIYEGMLAAKGQVNWSPELSWAGQLDASNINPASLLPDWPGKLNASLRSEGQLIDGELDVSADISEASGRLREHPFSLTGNLHWRNDALQVESASLTSGGTRIDTRGRVGQEYDLEWSLVSDDLASVYPTASGQLSASGHLGGERSAPIVKAQFKGQSLVVDDYRAATIDGDLAVDLLNWQQVDIRLTARDLDIQGQQLQSLTVNGNQRQFDASLVGDRLAAKLELSGTLVDQGWRGKLVTASLDTGEFANWRLQAPAGVSLGQNRLSIEPLCLQSSEQAEACASLLHEGETWDLDLNLTRMPLRLLQQWTPAELKLDGVFDASADLSYHPQGQLLGKLEARLPAARASYPLEEGKTEHFDFQQGEFKLSLEAQQVSANTRLVLQNGDQFEAALVMPGADILQLDTAQQTLQAQVRVDAQDWAVLDGLLPQVDNLRGRLQTDLKITGSFAKPRLQGNATLSEGAINLLESGLQFEQINANLHSDGSQPARFTVAAVTADGNIDIRGQGSKAISLDPRCLLSTSSIEACSNFLQDGETWDIDLDLAAIPLRLLRQWTPVDLELDGVFNAQGDLQYHSEGQLLGKLDANLPAARASYPLSEDQVEQLDYQSASLNLLLEAQQVTASGRLILQNGDQLDGSVIMPGADILQLDIEQQALRARIKVNAQHWGMLDAQVPQIANLQGALELDLQVTGNLNQPRLQGSASFTGGSVDLLEKRMKLRQIDLRAQSDGSDHARFTLEAKTAKGRIAVQGDTLLDRGSGWASNISLSGDDLDIATLIAPWVEQPLNVDGLMQASADLKYRAPDQLQGEIRLTSAQGKLTYPLLDQERERWKYQDALLTLILDDQGISSQSAVNFGKRNDLKTEVILPGAKLLTLDTEQQILEGSAHFNFTELDLVQYLIPEVDKMKGELKLDITLAGKLASPLLLANAEMQQASFNIPRLGLQIREIHLKGSSDADNQFNFKLTAESGDGKLSIKGSSLLDPARGWPSIIRIKGKEFEVSRIPEAHVTISPDLTINLEGRNILVEGDVLIPFAKLQPKDISTAARVSNDTVIIGSEKPPDERWLVTTRVNVILGERVTFFGFGFEGKLGGRLLIKDAPGELSVGVGEINIPEGRYRAYGQRLDVENGRLLFTGSALDNPGLDVRAVRTVNDIIVGLQLRGRLQQPEIELFSIPAMGQTDMLSYLLLGRPMETASGTEGEMMAQAALALGLAGGDTLARRIGDQFGLDEVRVESSDDGDQASLVVGRYLSPKLYVSYGVGLIESVNSLNLRYELTKNWKVEAESGEEQGADLLFTIER